MSDDTSTNLEVVRPRALVLGVALFVAAILCFLWGLSRLGNTSNELLLRRAAWDYRQSVMFPVLIASAGVMAVLHAFQKELTRDVWLPVTVTVLGIVFLQLCLIGWLMSPRVDRGEMELSDRSVSVRVVIPSGWNFAHGGKRPEAGGTLLDDNERARMSVSLGGAATKPNERWEFGGKQLEVERGEEEGTSPFTGFPKAARGEARQVFWRVRFDGFTLSFRGLLEDEAELRPLIHQLIRRIEMDAGR